METAQWVSICGRRIVYETRLRPLTYLIEMAYFAKIFSCMLEAAAMPQSGESLTLLRSFSKGN